MSVRVLCAITMVGYASLGTAVVRGQAPAPAPVPVAKKADAPAPRTPWGHPDLQGTWDYRTITPLERPRELGTKEFYTDEEAKALEGRAGRRMDGPP